MLKVKKFKFMPSPNSRTHPRLSEKNEILNEKKCIAVFEMHQIIRKVLNIDERYIGDRKMRKNSPFYEFLMTEQTFSSRSNKMNSLKHYPHI